MVNVSREVLESVVAMLEEYARQLEVSGDNEAAGEVEHVVTQVSDALHNVEDAVVVDHPSTAYAAEGTEDATTEAQE